MLCCAQLCQRVLSQPVANPHSRERYTKWANIRAADFLGHFFRDNELSLQSDAHFADFIFQKCSGRLRSFWHLKCKSHSRYSLVHIVPTSSSKSALNMTVLFDIFKCKSSCRYSPVHFSSATLPDLTPTTIFTREFTRFRTVTHHNCLMMGGWHDDAADMMKWCGCHDGGNADHDNRP